MMIIFAITSLLILETAQASVDWTNIIPLEPKLPRQPVARGKWSSGGSRITGGKEAEAHEFPYQVGILIHTANGTGFCGGSLLSQEWILTAAHCAVPGQRFTVILGAHNIRENETTQVRIEVTEKYVHEGYSPSGVKDDIAVLRLPRKVNLNAQIQTIRLPRYSQANETFVDIMSTVTGWGKDSDSASSISPILRKVDIPIIKNFVCDVFYFGAIEDCHICASGLGGKSSCNGDSGGPMVIKDKDRQLTQVGIVSFGITFGCQISWPPAFARVTYYLQWIENTTGVRMRP